MHPDLCRYTSAAFYDGKLHGVDGLGRQEILGWSSGLRLVEVPHQGNTNASPEEAREVARLAEQLTGRIWRDKNGTERSMEPTDILIVTPYNGQIRAIQRALTANGRVLGFGAGNQEPDAGVGPGAGPGEQRDRGGRAGGRDRDPAEALPHPHVVPLVEAERAGEELHRLVLVADRIPTVPMSVMVVWDMTISSRRWKRLLLRLVHERAGRGQRLPGFEPPARASGRRARQPTARCTC